ncbi:hypothetical protein RJ640_002360 [Escallonia rubra]|uniref:J domain-containing protein n=1 Tax=Escallonia rubra TaxID=112253 RepID=A0AA88U9A6_9ASTE|nr:hypothetical protein RJ640_002360 [Escallonia rubra]
MGEPPRSPTPNFYSILGIQKTATLTDICKAYKSLVMKWHPDKNLSKKSEAEAKFRSINEAYRVLSSKKREEEFLFVDEPKTPKNEGFASSPSIYSRSASRRTPSPTPRSFSRSTSRVSTTPTPASWSPSGNTTPTTPSTPKEAVPPAPFLSKVMSRKSTSTPIIFSQSTARRKPPPIEKKLECTLEELCKGCVKKIKITREVISDTGLIIQEEEILKIKVKPGWKKGTKITFEGKGDEKPGTLPADIIFMIDEKRHPMFKRQGDDLELGVEVPLIQALTGCTISVPLLGGEKMTLSLDDIIYPGYEKVIAGQGMPKSKEEGKRGDLRLNFLVEFPRELSDKQRSDVLSILSDCS